MYSARDTTRWAGHKTTQGRALWAGRGSAPGHRQVKADAACGAGEQADKGGARNALAKLREITMSLSQKLPHIQPRAPNILQIADQEFQRYPGLWKWDETALGVFRDMIVQSHAKCVPDLKAEVQHRKQGVTKMKQSVTGFKTDYDRVTQEGLIKWVLGKGYVLIQPTQEGEPWSFLAHRVEYVAVEIAIIRYGYVLTDWIEKIQDEHPSFRTAYAIGKPVVTGLVKIAGAGALAGSGLQHGEEAHLISDELEAAHLLGETMLRKTAIHKLDAAAMFAHAATRPGGEKPLPLETLFDENGLRVKLVKNTGQTR